MRCEKLIVKWRYGIEKSNSWDGQLIKIINQMGFKRFNCMIELWIFRTSLTIHEKNTWKIQKITICWQKERAIYTKKIPLFFKKKTSIFLKKKTLIKQGSNKTRVDWKIWAKFTVLYNARSNKCHCPNSPNTANDTKNESHDWSLTQMKRSLFTMRGATGLIVQTHQILRLPRKMTVQNPKEICWKRMKRHFQCAADPRMIRAWSDHDPSMIRAWNRQSATRLATEVILFTPTTSSLYWKIPAIMPNVTEYCACHEKWQLNFPKDCACHEK